MSYYNYPNKYKYYLFININIGEEENQKIFQMISEHVPVDKSQKQKIIIFEDNGEKKV